MGKKSMKGGEMMFFFPHACCGAGGLTRVETGGGFFFFSFFYNLLGWVEEGMVSGGGTFSEFVWVFWKKKIWDFRNWLGIKVGLESSGKASFENFFFAISYPPSIFTLFHDATHNLK